MYEHCTSTSFKEDIKDLCENCPMVDLINEAIEKKIIRKANQKKDLLKKNLFEEYLFDEIRDASRIMDETLTNENRNKNYKTDPYRVKRIEHYIWSKERIKALNSFLNDENNNSNWYQNIFKNKLGFNIFNDFSENINTGTELADYSFLYRKLFEDDLIHSYIKPSAFVEWLHKTFENIVIDSKLKTLDKCKTDFKMKLYQTIKNKNKSN